MELRREFLFTIGALVFVNLLLAFGSIGLFLRMGPAIAHILEENVVSIVAAEEMLAELAEANGGSLDADRKARLEAGLRTALGNITRSDERAELESLQLLFPAVVEGVPEARRRAIGHLRQLVRVNREAMREADVEARRLGSASAWTAVFVGLLSFVWSVFVVVRLQRRFLRPLSELHEVLEGARHGERFRRCRFADAPKEVVQVIESTNRLLDERLERGAPPEPRATGTAT